MENSTLPMADSEIIVDIFKYCVNINANLLKERDIEINPTDDTTNRVDTDVVMQEIIPLRVSDQLGSTSLADLILSQAELQMTTWKPDSTKNMQQFQDFDNEGFDVSKILFDIVQNSKLRFMQCKEVFLFGLKYSESTSASEWAMQSIENYMTLSLPETFKELQKL